MPPEPPDLTVCRALLHRNSADKSCVMFKNTTNSTIQHLVDKHKVIAYLHRLWELSSLGFAMGKKPPDPSD